MDDKKVVTSGQHEFTKDKQCLINLIAFYDETATWIDEGRAVDVIYLDFSKTFASNTPEPCYSAENYQ